MRPGQGPRFLPSFLRRQQQQEVEPENTLSFVLKNELGYRNGDVVRNETIETVVTPAARPTALRVDNQYFMVTGRIAKPCDSDFLQITGEAISDAQYDELLQSVRSNVRNNNFGPVGAGLSNPNQLTPTVFRPTQGNNDVHESESLQSNSGNQFTPSHEPANAPLSAPMSYSAKPGTRPSPNATTPLIDRENQR